MQTNSIRTTPQPRSQGNGTKMLEQSKTAMFPVSPKTLATLDFGLFRALCRLGTSRDRICAALCISYADFEHISKLTRV